MRAVLHLDRFGVAAVALCGPGPRRGAHGKGWAGQSLAYCIGGDRMGLADGTAELTGTATGVRGPGARCAVGPTNRPGDTDTGTGPPGGRWPDPDWAGSGRPGVHLRRGFGAGLSAEQTCRALTVGPFLIFRHAPGEGRGFAPVVARLAAWVGRGRGGWRTTPRRVRKNSHVMRIRNAHTRNRAPPPAAVHGGPRRSGGAPRGASDPAIAIGWPGRSAATSVDSSAPLTAFSKATAAGPARSRNPESPPSSQPYSH